MTNVLKLGCIADDYTGATDLCSMLVRTGRRVVQCFGVPDADEISGLGDADAIVIALKSRSIVADDAVRQSIEALRFLQRCDAQRFFFKYCSTFDSTAEGNIGQVSDALADQLGVETVFFCPAFPENGRTIHCGHLFVGGVLLSESGMRNHPLNPMTDSNLVRVLQQQTTRRVGWISPRHFNNTVDATALIVDSVDDDDLRRSARLASDHRLLTGGSAIAGHWADAIGVANSGDWPASDASELEASPTVILAGSCSDATQQQTALFEASHAVMHLPIDAPEDSQTVAKMGLDWFESKIDDGEKCVLFASGGSASAIEAARKRWGEAEAAERTETVFSIIAEGLQQRGVRRMIVAGGETSGSVINALGIESVRIGKEIAPGVPWITSIGASPMRLALKSGNFGGPKFFFDAMETI